MEMFTTNSFVFFYMSIMYTKLTFKMFSSYLIGIIMASLIFFFFSPSVCRVRDCSSEESFHLVIKIWKLVSENTQYVSQLLMVSFEL